MNNLKEIKIKITPEMGNLIIERLSLLASTATTLGSPNANMIRFNVQLINNQIAGEFREDDEGKLFREEAKKLIDVYSKSVEQVEKDLLEKEEKVVKKEDTTEQNK